MDNLDKLMYNIYNKLKLNKPIYSSTKSGELNNISVLVHSIRVISIYRRWVGDILGKITMRITRQADYATRTIYYLANLGPDQRASTHSIAQAHQIPSSFLSKIISRLSVAGLIRTTRGFRGGVSLAHSPSKISLLAVLEAIDGPIVVNDCLDDDYDCEYNEECPLGPFWCETQELLINWLKNATFDQFSPDGYKGGSKPV
jgi:Rrf2 family protein